MWVDQFPRWQRFRSVRVLTAFVLMSWLVPASLYGCNRFFNPVGDYADQGASGPYLVTPTGETENGRTVYRVAGPLEFVSPGARFGWVSTVCLEAGKSMAGRADVVRLSDQTVVISGPHRFWTPETKRCGPAVGSAIMSADATEGEYELQRTAILRPNSWFPLTVHLSGFKFRVRRGAGTNAAQ